MLSYLSSWLGPLPFFIVVLLDRGVCGIYVDLLSGFGTKQPSWRLILLWGGSFRLVFGVFYFLFLGRC